MNRTLLNHATLAVLLAATTTTTASASPTRRNAVTMPQAQKPAAPGTKTLDPARIKAVAAALPAQPTGPGKPVSDRAFWEAKAKQTAFAGMVGRAEALLKQPLPEQPDDLFLEYSRNGNRTRWQNVANTRRSRLTPLTLAECVENKGRFLPALEELINVLCAERTWVLPAHDAKLENFHGKTVDIDLGSSALAWNLAVADYLVGEKLRPETRQKLRAELERRIFAPYRDMLDGKRPRNWWMDTTNNWNAVCLGGVTGAALAQIPSREERARFAVAAEEYSRNFLAGFTPDGYCSEGLGYWNYGFGYFVLLAETLRQATGGVMDLMASPQAFMPAQFGTRIQIVNGISPAFADCAVSARPSAALLQYADRRFTPGGGASAFPVPNGTLYDALLYDTVASQGLPKLPAPRDAGENSPLRSWFGDAGILVARPAPGSSARLGVALKGGHNAEHHNHNDLGSFVVVLGERPVLLDPGGETYTARTFSSRRYESKLLNSFGHPVPVVAGTLQRTGAEAKAKVLRSEFTDAADTLALDLTSAYPVKELAHLRRTFLYSRQGAGALTVTDDVRLTAPKSFGTALLTLGTWKRQDDGSLLIYDGEEALRVEIDTGGRAFTIDAEPIEEDAAVKPTRLGINLTEPVAEATVTLKITPLTNPGGGGGSALLRNGGFEVDSWAWEMPKNSMGAVSTEQAASGKASLKITDDDPNAGSNVTSARIPIPSGGGKYALRGKVYHTSAGRGIGMYVRYLDADRKPLTTRDARGNEAALGTLQGDSGKWAPFAFPFAAPPETRFLQVWIHSFNAARVQAYLDDLEIAREP
jgi:Heparinase II/III-like protein.